MGKKLDQITALRGELTEEEDLELFQDLLDEHDIRVLVKSIKGFWNEDDIEELIAQLEG